MADSQFRTEMYTDMSDKSSMPTDAKSKARYAVENFKKESQISEYIKSFFDKKYGSNWHCIVGKQFNSFVSYDTKHYIFFYEG